MASIAISEVIQSVGYELSIFILTIALAVAFRGLPLGKSSAQSSKKPSALSRKSACSKQEDMAATAVAQNLGSTPTETVDAPCAAPSMSAVAECVWSMIELADNRQAAEALAIYKELRSSGEHVAIKDSAALGKQPAAVFSVLVQCAVRAGQPKLVETLIDDMAKLEIERLVPFYETVMRVLASKKYYKEALSICSRLEAEGLEPTPVTLSCLINFALDLDEPDRAIEFFNRLAAKATPTIRACMTILRLYSRRNDWERSFALLRELRRREARFDSVVLNIVLATGVAAGQLAATQALFAEFWEIADVVSCNIVAKSFAQQRDLEAAVNLLDQMHSAGLKPNAITFNTIMDAAVRSSQFDKAWNVLARMRDAGVAPDKFTCTTLMKRGLQSAANAEQLITILDLVRNVAKGRDSDVVKNLFRNAIEVATRLKDPVLAQRVAAQMQEHSVTLPPHEYQPLSQLLVPSSGAKRCDASRSWRHRGVEATQPISVY